jgi:hypothetical protein
MNKMNTNIFTINEMIEQKIPSSGISDEMLKKMAYAIEYFDFHKQPSHEDWAYWNKTRRALLDRLKALEEQKPIKQMPPKSNELSGQLWEDCRCGNQPIYMSHDCCENCAKDQEI